MKSICRLIVLMLGISLIVIGEQPSSTDATIESNIRLVLGIWGSPLSIKAIDNYDDFIAEDVQIHGPHGEERQGIETVKALDSTLATGFQELSTEAQDIFGTPDRVVVYWIWHAIHTAEYKGIPASGKTITLSGLAMFRFDESGKIVEIWTAWDELSLYKQIANVTIEPAI